MDILTPLITAGAAVLAVIVGNKLSYTRSYNEKIWALKRPAYGLILSELGEIEAELATARMNILIKTQNAILKPLNKRTM